MNYSEDFGFCGSEFWDHNKSWHTPDPSFTECFEKTILVLIPCLFLWLFASLQWRYLRSSPCRNIPCNWLNKAKMVLLGVILVCCTTELVLTLVINPGEGHRSIYTMDKISALLKLFTFSLVTALVFYNTKRGLRSSGVVFLFWLLYSVCGAPQFRTTLRHEGEVSVLVYCYLVFYPAVVSSLMLNFWAEPGPSCSQLTDEEKLCPKQTYSFPSRTTFAWMFPLICKGSHTTLTTADLWSLELKNSLSSIKNEFVRFSNSLPCGPRHNNFKHSVLWPIVKAIGPTILYTGILKLISDLLLILNSPLQSWLFAFIARPAEDVWKGYFYTSLFFLNAVCGTVFKSQHEYRNCLIDLRVHSALSFLIYRKVLKTPMSALRSSGVEDVVNLLAVDVRRVVELVIHFSQVWFAPLHACFILYFLWQILGWSVLAGIAILFGLTLMTVVLSRVIRAWQIKHLKVKDERLLLTQEVLQSKMMVMLKVLEDKYEEKLLIKRENETNILKHLIFLRTLTVFTFSSTGFLMSLGTFAVYLKMDEKTVLTSEKAFESLLLFAFLQVNLYSITRLAMTFSESRVSLKRINNFLSSKEVTTDNTPSPSEADTDSVVVEDGTFSWGWSQDRVTVLQNINLRVKHGSLVAVVGTVGSGKSSLLAAMLGEMDKITGQVITKGRVAYVPQEPWILNATIRENILFSHSCVSQQDWTRYFTVLQDCALNPDFATLPAGDNTEVGERGVNLSGGQKQRVALARAVYSDSDVYLLDDPLSTLDSGVGRHVFDCVINGLLSHKTVILATHSPTYLCHMDMIVMLKDGQISETGTYDQLFAQNGDFRNWLTENQAIGNEMRPGPGALPVEEELSENFAENTTITQQRSSGQSVIDRLVEEEKTEEGQLKLAVYRCYLRSVGPGLALLIVLLYAGHQVFYALTVGYSDVWNADSSATGNSSLNMFYIKTYTVFGLITVALHFCAKSLSLWLLLVASQKLHRSMLQGVLKAPISFTHSNPLSRIIARFARDIDILDWSLPSTYSRFLLAFFQVLAVLFSITYTFKSFVFVAVVVAILFVIILSHYTRSSRQLRRLESVSRSPIYSALSQTYHGAAVIRAFGVKETFQAMFEKKVDFNQRCHYPLLVANRWLVVWVEMLGNLVILFMAGFSVHFRDSVGASHLYFIITYSLQIVQSLRVSVTSAAEIITNMVAVERVKEYADISPEEVWFSVPQAPASWPPPRGEVVFEDFEAGYREGQPKVLKKVNIKILAGEKVGIVGRTGAGKSSLCLSLSRILVVCSGKIVIDGVDIRHLGLRDLRSNITIILQEPVLISGTLRGSLDPLETKTDQELKEFLKKVHLDLDQFVSEKGAGLNFPIARGGVNLSIGQRQLICLARALLRKTKVLVLDEATADIDLETDNLIKQTIRREFSDCTVLTVTHRLNTVMDSDKVMVVADGQVKEFDTPTTLLRNQSSAFYRMARIANLV